jgi:DNA polymerase/3'-5' exonuclease PolX
MKSELEKIPGVGVRIAGYISELGFHDLNDLKKANAEKMFSEFCFKRGEKIDRCLLYVFRGAVKFAKKPHKKNWWEFKD